MEYDRIFVFPNKAITCYVKFLILHNEECSGVKSCKLYKFEPDEKDLRWQLLVTSSRQRDFSFIEGLKYMTWQVHNAGWRHIAYEEPYGIGAEDCK